MADAVFDASGNVSGSGNRRIANAWSGSGSEIANLLGSANMQTLPSLLAETTTTTTTTAPKYSYPESKVKKDYSMAAYSQPRTASLFSGDTQSALQQYINAVNSGNLGSISNRDAVNDALSQYNTIQQALKAQQTENDINTLLKSNNIRDLMDAYTSYTSNNGANTIKTQVANTGMNPNELLALGAFAPKYMALYK